MLKFIKEILFYNKKWSLDFAIQTTKNENNYFFSIAFGGELFLMKVLTMLTSLFKTYFFIILSHSKSVLLKKVLTFIPLMDRLVLLDWFVYLSHFFIQGRTLLSTSNCGFISLKSISSKSLQTIVMDNFFA